MKLIIASEQAFDVVSLINILPLTCMFGNRNFFPERLFSNASLLLTMFRVINLLGRTNDHWNIEQSDIHECKYTNFTARVRSRREGNVLTRVCLSVYMGRGYLPPRGRGTYFGQGEGIPTLDGEEGTYFGWEVEVVPTLEGEGVHTYLGWEERGYLPWRGGGTYLGLGGVLTLDRLYRGLYASCGFSQEDFLVFWKYWIKSNITYQMKGTINCLPTETFQVPSIFGVTCGSLA